MLLGKSTQDNTEVVLSSPALGVHIIGAKRMGKSTLFEHLIAEVLQSDQGLCLLDPHGDLVRTVVALIPENRLKDVIVFNPLDIAYPIGLNLYACKDPAHDTAVKSTITRIMHIFDKVYGVTRDTPVMAQFLRNTAYTIVANGLTMVEIPLLLTNRTVRDKLVRNVKNPHVRLFWQEYDEMTAHDRRMDNKSTLNKIDEFVTDSITCRIIGQATTTISLADIMDTGKILLVSLPGHMFDFTSLLGSILISEIMTVALERADVPKDQRKPFHLFADEYGRFCTKDFATLIEELGKYNIIPYIAYQVRSQLDERNKSSTLQLGNFICFRITSEDAQELASEFDCTPPQATKPDPVIPRNVLSYLSKHPDPCVRDFYGSYIAKMSQAAHLDVEKETMDVPDKTRLNVMVRERHYFLPDYDFGEGSVEYDPDDVAQTLLAIETFLYNVCEQKRVNTAHQTAIMERMSDYLKFRAYWEYTTSQQVASHVQQLQQIQTTYARASDPLQKEWDRNTRLFSDDEAFLAYVAEDNRRKGYSKDITAAEVKQQYIDIAKNAHTHTAFDTPEKVMNKLRRYPQNFPELTPQTLCAMSDEEFLQHLLSLPYSTYRLWGRETTRGFFVREAEQHREIASLTTCEKVLACRRSKLLTPLDTITQKLQEVKAKMQAELAAATKRHTAQLAVEQPRYDRFCHALGQVTQALLASPIAVYSTEWQNTPVTQQTYTDKKNEIANELAHLPPYHARVRLGSGEYTIKTLPSHITMSEAEVNTRLDQLIAATRATYCRASHEVDKEINDRHKKLLEQIAQEPEQAAVDVPAPRRPRRPRSEPLP